MDLATPQLAAQVVFNFLTLLRCHNYSCMSILTKLCEYFSWRVPKVELLSMFKMALQKGCSSFPAHAQHVRALLSMPGQVRGNHPPGLVKPQPTHYVTFKLCCCVTSYHFSKFPPPLSTGPSSSAGWPLVCCFLSFSTCFLSGFLYHRYANGPQMSL